MEVCAKLESFLEDHELHNIPEIAKRKISEQFTNLNQVISELRNEKLELTAVLERQQFEFEKEISTSQQQLEECTGTCTKLKLQIGELEGNLNSVQKEWRDLQKVHDSAMLEFQASKRENELLNQEKKNLAEQLEKRREEIEKLNGDLKCLLDQTTAANEAKFEAIATSEEAKLRESNLQHQVMRLEQEKDLLNRQIADLNTELTEKNHEIHTLKREKSNNILDLKTQLENRADEIHLLQKRQDCLKENLEEKDQRIEALAEKIRQLNESHSKAEEQFNLELNAQAKLIDLHKKASEDNQQRVQELMRAFEEAQKLLKESNEAVEEIEKHCQNVEIKCKEQLEEKENEIALLKEELKKTKDLANGMSQEAIEKIFPVAAATSKVLHSGMTLTELYIEYTKIQEELRRQKSENTNLTQELKQIVSEIEEKTPLINQRMYEYEKSKETISCLKSQLANALMDYEMMLEERNDAKRICNLTERENARLKNQVTDLNRQVQVLLKEVEEARGGHVRHDASRILDDDVTSSDDVTADKIISRHLVTFRDIEEIQTKNQKLLAVIRDLSQQHEELEKKLSSELTEKFQKDIEALSVQLEDLQQKRTKQSEMLETIIRQRDMYRVLLTSQGFSESLLGQPDGSLSVLQNSSKLSPGDPRLKEAKTAMNQLQAEFNNYKKEKCENERMLNEQLDKMRSDVSDLKIKNAKLASQCEYSEERVKILQSNLETYKKEYMSFKEKNRQHSSLIIQHQQTINSLRQDLMVSQEKLAKAEVTIENLKAECELLKNVESRLLQEKESIMKEQQHQSRLMANLQAVQNNLERIESETKRNLQYQVEKLEKENAILKTKVDNANEEYRSAVKIWEKQNKELQQKVDAEVERNRKLHEDLVDAYSQVHALNQELLNTKAQLPSTPDKAVTEASNKTPVKATSGVSPSVTEVKQLKEQLNEAQQKLKSVQEKLDIVTKSSEQYLSMCQDLEMRVKEQDEINRQLKETMDSTLNSSKLVQTCLEKNLENMEKTNRELIEENMKISQNSGSQADELQKRISELVKSVEDYKHQAQTCKEVADQARADCQTQMKLMEDVQGKYERELMLHAQDIQAMTTLKEEHQHCSEKIEKLSDMAKVAEQNLQESRESWKRQEEIFNKEIEALKQRLVDLEACNQNLHEQLDLMGTQMAALQSKNWDETPYASIQSDLKDTQHLLQVIQFIKKEKEICSTQYDVAKSENVRLKLKLEQMTIESNETKAELKEILGNFQAKAASEAQHTELLKKVEMLNLLTESNNLLRMEKESLSVAKSKLETQVHELEEKLQPLIEKEKEICQQNDMLAAENSALRAEVKSWQSRTNQLLEQSHRIGPQEYKNMMREMEELKNQKTRLAEELQKKQAEVSQITANSSAVKKELEAVKNSLKDKNVEVARMTKEIAEHQKTLLQIKKIGRKYKTQFDELKLKYDDLVAKSKSTDISEHEQALQGMQKKLEESEKSVRELKEEIEKEKESASLSKQALSKASEKEERAIKLLTQFRQKFSQMNSQKESLSEENKKLTKDIENFKSQISSMVLSQEENIATVARLEKELRRTKELHHSEKEFLQKQYDDLYQKVTLPGKQLIKPNIGLGERASGSGSEPLTANIKPLTAPSTSGVSPSLRHSTHPHAAVSVSRPTPTASIRPMAISSVSPAAPTQARMATVLPTTATPSHTEEDSAFGPTATPAVSVPHPVQPITAMATVAPTTMAITVSPVISEVSAPEVNETSNIEEHRNETLQAHVIGILVAPSPVTALVTPRIDVTDVSEQVTADSPAPTTSVIVSPPATQVVVPTVKRSREESPSSADVQEGSLKRMRMISEGSQTSQHSATPSVSGTSNVAIVPAAQVVPCNKPQDTPPTESHLTVQSVPHDVKDTPVAVIASAQQPSTSAVVDESIVPTAETTEAEILDDDDEKDEQNIEWEPQDDTKIEEYDAEVMEEEAVVIDENEELEDDVEQMQGIDAKSPDDEDMSEEQQEEEMADQPNPNTDVDILDATSDIQMDADSSSLQTAPTEQCMAPPPAFPPTLEVAARPDAPPPIDTIILQNTSSTVQPSLPVGPPRLDRQPTVSRQHLTPFTIPGQGSNFEEGDDSIVPSTPTLYVPRRTDGFAEAVSSPHVPQVRFLFSSSDSSPTQQSYAHSQLASQGALGVDDTRMDLFDEGSSRAVPSTPLQVSPPVEIAVPDVPQSLETVPSSEVAAGIEIKIDLVEESAEANTAFPTAPKDSSESTSLNIDASKGEPKEENVEQKSESSSTEATITIEENKASTSSEIQASEEPAKGEENQDTEQQNKEAGGAQSTQRKPIVWNKDSTETTDAPDAASTPALPTAPAPVRGRPRARRARYATAPPYSSRGRGETTWTAPTRRGRGAARKRY